MAVELASFLAAALVITIPGILLAASLRLGRTPLDRLTYGASLGFAAACYLGSLISHLDLRWFFPLWAIFFLFALIAFFVTRQPRMLDHSLTEFELWMAIVLLLVAITRFAAVLPHEFPRGWDPAFHMILAEKIRLTHHAINDWSPFDSALLNYPTGMHVLLVQFSTLTGLSLPTVFKDLIPLIGILTTAQIFTLSRHLTSDPAAGLFAAIAYAFWAIDGSVGYSLWGGLPNELAMLFFIALLSIWMDSTPTPGRIAAMALLYAAVILVHHHVMIASAAVLAVCLIWSMSRNTTEWKVLLIALVIAAILDGFFLIPYAARAATLGSTHILYDGETVQNPLKIPGDRLGYAFTFAAAAGVALWAMREGVKFDTRLILATVTLLALFALCDYTIPPLVQPPNLPRSTVFTASRFLADAAYFLAAAAGAAAASVQRSLKIRTGVMVILLLLIGGTLWQTWQDVATPPDIPDGFVAACRWIRDDTPPDSIVANVQPWTAFFCWRKTILNPIPISEPVKDRHALIRHLQAVFSGNAPADPNLLVVQIVPPGDYHDRTILWKDVSGIVVLRIWPK